METSSINTTNFLSTNTFKWTTVTHLGVQLQDVQLYSHLMRTWITTAAQPVINIIVWNVNANTTTKCHVLSTGSIIPSAMMIRSFKNSFVEPNINNAQSASFGYKGLKDVVQCLVDAGRNFATTVAALGAHMGAALILDRQILSTI